MAETKEKAQERVELYVPRGAQNDDPNLFISINGVNYLLPKGQKSMVPPCVKAEYERSLRAQAKRDDNADRMAHQ
jgi:hypothetical protein